MLAKVNTFGLLGIEAYPVAIEVDIAHGLPAVNFVGLADTAIRESKERVKSAIKNSGFRWPHERITVSLAPSDIKKEGTCFDLPIALGILAATAQVDPGLLNGYCALGELSLDGRLHPVTGVLPAAMAQDKGEIRNLLLPAENAEEAGVIAGIKVFALHTLKECVAFLNDNSVLSAYTVDISRGYARNSRYELDFSEVKGQYLARRAIEVAVAGKHNIMMIGPPGSGKTMLARRIPTIMPDLTIEECLEITKAHSAAERRASHHGLICTRPFRAPHHTATHVALAGGGTNPRPGEISLAHQGVLFLDELPEFSRECLETLRQPLESGTICIARLNRTLTLPASFMLACALNPCPCGYYGDPRKACHCSTTQIKNYLGRISGPLLDRIDIHIEIPAMRYKELCDAADAESSHAIRARVQQARLIQTERFKAQDISYNAQMNPGDIKRYCQLDREGQELMKMAMQELALSARVYDRILKVGRTIADLANAQDIRTEHIAEAIQYRSAEGRE